MIKALMMVIVLAMSGAQERKTGTASVTGTVAYRERIALPADAIVIVRVEDVSLQDAPAKLIAETTVPTAGKQVPIAFALSYDPGEIQSTHRYVLRAKIVAGERMLFTSTTAYPVITGGSRGKVSIMVQRVKASASGPALENTEWNLVQIGGNPVQPAGTREPYLMFQSQGNKLSGTAGCNRLFGGYQLSKGSLRFKPVGSTMMACADPLMKQERALIEALEGTSTYRISGTTLELLNGDRVLAKLQAKQN